MKALLSLFIGLGLILFSERPVEAQSSAPVIGAQVFIEPGQRKEDVEKWFSLLEKSHMNVCRIRMFETHMRKKDGTWDFSIYDDAFDRAARHNIKIFATLFPATSTGDVGGFKFPKSEDHLQQIAGYIRAVVVHFREHPALQAWVLQNEPGVGTLPDNPFSRKMYDEWEKQKPKDPYQIPFHKESLDDHLFVRYYTTWYLHWIHDQIQQYDSIHEYHVNNHMLFVNLWQYDFPSWMPFLSHLGASIHAGWHLGYFNRDQYAMAINADCDIIRGGAAPKPFWVTELQGGNNLFSAFRPMCPTPEDIDQWVWSAVASGAKGVIFWTLNPRSTGPEAGEWSMLTYQNEPSERLTEAAKISGIIHDNNTFFASAKPVTSDITILYCAESMITQDIKDMHLQEDEAGRKTGAHIKSALSYYQTLLELGLPANLIEMGNYPWKEHSQSPRLAILPDMVTIPSRYWDDLYRFVGNGNKLIITGLSGFYDEYLHNVLQDSVQPLEQLVGACVKEFKVTGRYFNLILEDPPVTLPAHLWRGEVQPLHATPTGKYQDETVAVRYRFKKGEVVFIPSLIGLGSWQRDNEAMAAWLKKETAGYSGSLPFVFATHYPHVILKVMTSGKNFLTVLINTDNKKHSVALIPKVKKTPTVLSGGSVSASHENYIVDILPNETIVIKWE